MLRILRLWLHDRRTFYDALGHGDGYYGDPFDRTIPRKYSDVYRRAYSRGERHLKESG